MTLYWGLPKPLLSKGGHASLEQAGTSWRTCSPNHDLASFWWTYITIAPEPNNSSGFKTIDHPKNDGRSAHSTLLSHFLFSPVISEISFMCLYFLAILPETTSLKGLVIINTWDRGRKKFNFSPKNS